MQIPIQINYRRCRRSARLDELIYEKAYELERFYPRITSCRVLIEGASAHHRKGKGAHYRVRVEVTVPTGTLIASRDPAQHMANQDVFLATREAFDAARRQLQHFASKIRGEVKTAKVRPLEELGEELGV